MTPNDNRHRVAAITGGAAGIGVSLGDSISFNIEGRGVFKDDLRTAGGSATLRFQQDF